MTRTYAEAVKCGPPLRGSFFDLPIELRQQVYNLLCPRNNEFRAINVSPLAPEDRYKPILATRSVSGQMRGEVNEWLSRTCGAYFYMHDNINLYPDEVLYAPPLPLPYHRLRYIEVYVDYYNTYNSGAYDACQHMWHEGSASGLESWDKVWRQRKQMQDLVAALRRFGDWSLPILYVRLRDDEDANPRHIHRSRRDFSTTWCDASECLARKSFDLGNDVALCMPRYILEPLLGLPVCGNVIVQPLHFVNVEERTVCWQTVVEAAGPRLQCRAQEYMDTLCTAYERWIEGQREEPFDECWKEIGRDRQRGSQDRERKLEMLKQVMPSDCALRGYHSKR